MPFLQKTSEYVDVKSNETFSLHLNSKFEIYVLPHLA